SDAEAFWRRTLPLADLQHYQAPVEVQGFDVRRLAPVMREQAIVSFPNLGFLVGIEGILVAKGLFGDYDRCAPSLLEPPEAVGIVDEFALLHFLPVKAPPPDRLFFAPVEFKQPGQQFRDANLLT